MRGKERIGKIDSREKSTSAKRIKIEGVTGVILAGGKSKRMGSNKALLPYRGGKVIEAVYRQMANLFHEVIIVTNNPEQYSFLPCRKVPDIYQGFGSLAGIHSALRHSKTERVFIAACDMPYLEEEMVRYMASREDEKDVVIPESDMGLEPLFAIYHKNAIPAIEEAIKSGERRIASLFPKVKVTRIPKDEVALVDQNFRSFFNINTPQDYSLLREKEEAKSGKGREKEMRRKPKGTPKG